MHASASSAGLGLWERGLSPAEVGGEGCEVLVASLMGFCLRNWRALCGSQHVCFLRVHINSKEHFISVDVRMASWLLFFCFVCFVTGSPCVPLAGLEFTM